MNHFDWKVVCCVLAAFLVVDISVSASPSAQCLQCICHASSGCKTNIRCHNSGAGQYFCGPYQISWAYWADGGKPGYTGLSNDFENCLVDKNCAEATVRGYMAKWGTDCNGDGQVDCFDYAAIHKAGPTGCNQPWLLNSKYWSEFNQCYSAPSSASASNSASSSPSISSSLTAISANPNTIIEIPQPSPPRHPLSHTSAISSSSSSTAFGPIPPTPDVVESSFSSSSSFSRHNFSHSEVEISESVTSDGFPNLANSPPPLPNFIANPLPATNFKPLTRPYTGTLSVPSLPSPQPSPPRPEITVPTYSNVKPANFNPIVPSDCLECLCQASSKCNLNKGCDGAYCGPFLLSWGYWADGGKPGNGLDYPSCAKDRTCAELAVHGYMNKWNRDCNRDGIVDCTDYALIHKLGPHACGKVEAIQPTDYWKSFTKCQNSDAPEERNPSERSIVSSDNLNSLSESSEPEIIEESPALVEQPLPRYPESSFPPNSNPTPPDASSVRISFNNRDIVNTNLPNARVPPAPLHHRPLTPHSPPIQSPPSSINELNQPNNNLNVISNSPLRPTFSNQPPYSSIVSPVTQSPPVVNKPPNELTFETDRNKPLVRSDNPNSVSSLNEDYYSNARAAYQPSTAPLPQPISRESSTQPKLSEANYPSLPSNRNPKAISNITGSNSLVAPECIECICHASSRCNLSLGCKNDGSGKYICGPFQVDWEYWNEAGKPGNRADLSNLENLQTCLTNRQCADETVRGYLQKWRKDCNEDGVIDCNDFAALHVAGPHSCNAQWFLDSQYYSDFRSCYDFRRR